MGTLTPNNIFYSDFLVGFDVHPTKADLVRATNEAAVKRSVRNLLMLNKEERFFKPQVGSGIRAFLFEPMTPFTAIGLRNEIKEVLTNYEKRISIVDVTVDPLYDQNSYNVRLVFYMINKPEPISYSVSLERVR